MEHGNFKELVEDAVALVHHGALRKVAGAAVDRALPAKPQASALIERLRAEADGDTTVYWYDLPGDTSFIGATPETLFRINDGDINTMALAGSRLVASQPRRGPSPRQRTDEQHQRAQRAQSRARTHLPGFGRPRRRLDVPASPSLRKLGSVQHLQTDLQAKLSASDPFDLLSQLHPTPAVCGLPTALAADHIQRQEKLQRGLYSGVLGWMTPQHCHTIVPLRGGLVSEHKARLLPAPASSKPPTRRRKKKKPTQSSV